MKNDTDVNDKSFPFEFLLKKSFECYTKNKTHSKYVLNRTNEPVGNVWCPRTFDGLLCWDSIPPAAIAIQPCPGFIVGFDTKFNSSRRCMENGSWYHNPLKNRSWTNYVSCVDQDDLHFRNIVNIIYVVGYSLSLFALLMSIVIFLYFRTLHCIRIRIHMHLFASLAFNNILWIIWYRTIVNDAQVVADNGWWCQILHVVTHYFMVASYMWMFCEGLHLHVALVVVFVKDDVAMKWFYALGWGLSFMIVGSYALTRYMIPGASVRCWVDESNAFYIIVVPIVLSLVSSLIFLVNVVRVLLTKLHPAPDRDVPLAAKKAARATLILIPLFGLHFILIPFRPSPETPGEKVYQVISAILTSLQGLCVSILFCFTNHDVMVTTKNHFARCWSRRVIIPMTGVTTGESLMNTRENAI